MHTNPQPVNKEAVFQAFQRRQLFFCFKEMSFAGVSAFVKLFFHMCCTALGNFNKLQRSYNFSLLLNMMIEVRSFFQQSFVVVFSCGIKSGAGNLVGAMGILAIREITGLK